MIDRDQPIMLVFLPIMLFCSAHKLHLLRSCERFVLRNRNTDCFARVYIRKTKYLYGYCRIRVNRSLVFTYLAKHFLLRANILYK